MRHLFTFFLLLVNLVAGAQPIDKRWDNWYFQSQMGLQINGCNEAPLNGGKMYRAAGVCTISDSLGNLLFYSNSQSVLNKNHQLMPNGDLGPSWGGGVYHWQGPIIMPMPGSDHLYYMFHVFSTDVYVAGNYRADFHYDIIDKNADNGNGDLIVKNRKLYTSTTEATGAVFHSNNVDYWIVTHKAGSDSFAVFKLTAAGLDTVARYYKVGPSIGEAWRDKQIVIKFSPDRKKMVVSRNIPKQDPQNYERDGGFDLYNFNAATGEISNPIVIRDGFVSQTSPVWDRYFSTGAEFSPNSRYLYVSTWDHLFQFDTEVHDYTAINNSRAVVANTDIYSYGFGHILMGSNGKLYQAKFYSNEYLATIEKPDNPAPACQFNPNGVYFPGTNWNNDLFLGYGLNNCIQPYVKTKPYSENDLRITSTCMSDSASFQVWGLNADSVHWNFGDPISGPHNFSKLFEAKHFYAAPGDYMVTCIIFSHCSTDTIYKDLTIGTPILTLTEDTAACMNETLVLRAYSEPGVSYTWSNGSKADSLLVNAGGAYWVQASRAGCTVADTVNVNFIPLPQVFLGADTTICTGESLTLDASDPAIAQYNWSTGQSTPSISIQTAGIFWLEATGNNGCSIRDSIILSLANAADFTLGNDTTLCEAQSLNFDFSVPGATYLWSTGQHSGFASITTAGLYWLTVSANGCAKTDSIEVMFLPSPVVMLGADTSVCEGSSFSLYADPGFDTILWQDGSTGNTFVVDRGGTYTVKVAENGCYDTDTIHVTQRLLPRLELGKDTSICLEQGLLLNPGLSNVSYQWQDGSGGPTFFVKQEGLYQLTATNFCGSVTDKIRISRGVCVIAMPTAFTPNNDGRNDVWRVPYPGLIKTMSMVLYNRWGEKVFETTNPYTGWDGTFKGRKLDTGNFVWMISYEDYAGNKQSLKGTVLLIR